MKPSCSQTNLLSIALIAIGNVLGFLVAILASQFPTPQSVGANPSILDSMSTTIWVLLAMTVSVAIFVFWRYQPRPATLFTRIRHGLDLLGGAFGGYMLGFLLWLGAVSAMMSKDMSDFQWVNKALSQRPIDCPIAIDRLAGFSQRLDYQHSFSISHLLAKGLRESLWTNGCFTDEELVKASQAALPKKGFAQSGWSWLPLHQVLSRTEATVIRQLDYTPSRVCELWSARLSQESNLPLSSTDSVCAKASTQPEPLTLAGFQAEGARVRKALESLPAATPTTP